MAVKINGKENLLTGFYQNIIIKEGVNDNYNVTVTPNDMSLKNLDNAYSHLKIDHIKSIPKIKSIIDYYLNNNTIFLVSDRGSLKGYKGDFIGINGEVTISTFLKYKSINRALYLQLKTIELQYEYQKILLKYLEDRIRHMDKILSCKNIEICASLSKSGYIINGDTAYIYIKCNYNYQDDIKYTPVVTDVPFLEELLYNFFCGNQIQHKIFNDGFIEYVSNDKTLAIDEDLRFVALNARGKYIDEKNKDYDYIVNDALKRILK